MYNVLVIVASRPDLPPLATDREISLIGDVPGIQLNIVLEASLHRITDRLNQANYEALLVIGHGGPGTVFLSDGELEPLWLAEHMKNRGISLAVLATCQSDLRTEQKLSFSDVLPAANIDVVTMWTSISDTDAIAYDVTLFQALASGSSLRAAHNLGLNRLRQRGSSLAPKLTPKDGQTLSRIEWKVTELSMRLETMLDKVKDVEESLARMEGFQQQQAQEMTRLATRQTELEDLGRRLEIRQLSAAPKVENRGYLVIGTILMCLILFLLLFVTWRIL